MRGFRHTAVARRLRERLGGADDRGSALIEFIVIGLLLTLPVFYLVITLARLQAGTYAVAAAARESSRMFVTADGDAAGETRSQAAAAMAFADQGFRGEGKVQMRCSKHPCLSPDSVIEGVTDLDVELPLIPDFLRGVVPSSIHLHSRHAEVVDHYRARR
ncbi:MAG TPA: pilus assembly protein [Flexivirga sp.]|uniref:pilus assembly protein n=1 Tax=Flexivirga sp. TaxID=1962927 RepID=UPI002CA051E2|nr:pilus assembly protein [Flexivirga sp.]HWC21373.1 pilus assembly protein [Flexivirga sp.]